MVSALQALLGDQSRVGNDIDPSAYLRAFTSAVEWRAAQGAALPPHAASPTPSWGAVAAQNEDALPSSQVLSTHEASAVLHEGMASA